MFSRRFLTTVALCTLAFIAFVGMESLCGGGAPDIPTVTGPTGDVYQRASTRFKLVTTHPKGDNVYFVVDWGDGEIDTSVTSYSGDSEEPEEASMYHRWDVVGTYEVNELAYTEDDEDKTSDWSAPQSLGILANNYPVPPVVINPPAGAVKGIPLEFRAMSWDPDGDLVQLKWDFGDWQPETGAVPGSTVVVDTNRFSKIETTEVWCIARDTKGSESDRTTLTVVVGEAGAVRDWWYSDAEEEGIIITAPVVADAGGGIYYVYCGADYPNKYYSFSIIDGELDITGSASPEDQGEENVFEGHGAYARNTGNHIVGNEDGELYAFSRDLDDSWRFPNAPDTMLLGGEWGAPAINGNRIYVANHSDTIFYLTDNFSSVTLKAVYYVPGVGENCIIDNAGNVIVANDSGDIYKFDGELNLAPGFPYRVGTPNPLYVLYTPSLDENANIIVGAADGMLYSVKPDGSGLNWSVQLNGEVYRAVVGNGAIFASTSSGRVYSIVTATGAITWDKMVSETGEIVSSPALCANGFMYLQDDGDFVYCINTADGSLVWVCDCQSQGPNSRRSGGGGRDFDRLEASLTIHPNGDILVVGEDAFYLVAGYKDQGLLNAPWPSWQKDQENSGKMSGW